LSSEEIEKIIKKKAECWAREQSKERLERILLFSNDIIHGNNKQDELRIKLTIQAINYELFRRANEEALRIKEEIKSIFR
jgi:hypothetical protein